MLHPESSYDDAVAWEKGRLLAAQSIASDPLKRKEIEEKFGVEVCKRYFPEVYAPRNAFRRTLDRIFPYRLERIDR